MKLIIGLLTLAFCGSVATAQAPPPVEPPHLKTVSPSVYAVDNENGYDTLKFGFYFHGVANTTYKFRVGVVNDGFIDIESQMQWVYTDYMHVTLGNDTESAYCEFLFNVCPQASNHYCMYLFMYPENGTANQFIDEKGDEDVHIPG